jgi:hypothetical protein
MAVSSTILGRYSAAITVRWHSSITIRSSFCLAISRRAYLTKPLDEAASALTSTNAASRRSPGCYSRWSMFISRTRRSMSTCSETSGTTSIVIPASGSVYSSMNSKLFLAPVGRIAITCLVQDIIAARACSYSSDF